MHRRRQLQLTESEKREVREHLLTDVVRGPQRTPLFVYLFGLWLRTDRPRQIAIKDIIAGCSEYHDADEGAVRTAMSRLEKTLERHDVACACRVKLHIGHGYQPEFFESVEDEIGDRVDAFWTPYAKGLPPYVLYPEPVFYRDGNDTYVRNPAAQPTNGHEQLKYLRYKKPLEPDYSFVPSGVVEGMLFLLETFQRLGIEFRTKAFRGDAEVPLEGREPLIVLGTPATTQHIAALEAPTSAHTTHRGVTVHTPRKEYLDSTRSEVLTGTKYALLTRRVVEGRVVTVLTAAHGRVVQALAKALTNETDLSALASRYNGSFPDTLQAIFKVNMVVVGEPQAHSIRPIRVLKA